MNPVVAGMFGAAVMGLAVGAGYGVYVGVKRFWKLVDGQRKAIEALTLSAEKANVLLAAVGQELAFMRQMSTGQYPAGVEASPDPDTFVQSPPQPRERVDYPSPVWERFKTMPPEKDATVEDTNMDVLKQTDEDMRNIEMIEGLRQRGIEVEDDDVHHPGITAEI